MGAGVGLAIRDGDSGVQRRRDEDLVRCLSFFFLPSSIVTTVCMRIIFKAPHEENSSGVADEFLCRHCVCASETVCSMRFAGFPGLCFLSFGLYMCVISYGALRRVGFLRISRDIKGDGSYGTKAQVTPAGPGRLPRVVLPPRALVPRASLAQWPLYPAWPRGREPRHTQVWEWSCQGGE